MKTKLLIALSLFVLIIGMVSAAVTYPLPSSQQLTPGESGRFKFQIQATNVNNDIKCTFSLQGESPLRINFDKDSVTVPRGGTVEVFGGVVAPNEYDLFVQKFCVACSEIKSGGGVDVAITTCDIPVNVVVVRNSEDMTKTKTTYKIIPPTKKVCKTQTDLQPVTKTREVTKYREVSKERPVTKYATLFQQWTEPKVKVV